MSTRNRIMLSMSDDEIEGIDKARGTLPRATWCRQAIAGKLARLAEQEWQEQAWRIESGDYVTGQNPPQDPSPPEDVSSQGAEGENATGGNLGAGIDNGARHEHD